VLVWQDKDGKYFIVDGHQRLAKNIAEGTGTAEPQSGQTHVIC
jgi:hypothetical protein